MVQGGSAGREGQGRWQQRLAALREAWFAWTVCALGLLAAAQVLGLLDGMDRIAYDNAVATTGAAQQGPPVVLVGVTEQDIVRFGWPLNDGVLAQALERIEAAGASAIGVDLYRDAPVGSGQDSLDRVVARHRNIVFASSLSSATAPAIVPRAALAASQGAAFADLPVDEDGVVRRALLFAEDGGAVQSSFALRLALLALAEHQVAPSADPAVPGAMRLGAARIERLTENSGPYSGLDAAGYQTFIDYRDRSGFRRLSLSTLLDDPSSQARLHGALVILGTTAESVKDSFLVPSRGLHAETSAYGIEVHAHIASQLIRHARQGAKSLASTPALVTGVLLGLMAMAGLAIGLALPHSVKVIVATLGVSHAWLAVFVMAFEHGLWLRPVGPLGALLLAAAGSHTGALRRMHQRKDELMALFSRYFSRNVAEQIWERRQELLQSGGMPRPRQLPATVFFCDLKGFTGMAETLAPDQLAEVLNSYFDLAVEAIYRHGGSVDKFIGDAVLAVFGAPIPRTEEEQVALDARAAVRAAHEIGSRVAGLNARLRERGLPEIAVRIGVHSGPVISGSFGSVRRVEFTVIGDTVNAAARLEGLDKSSAEGAWRIFLSENTRRHLDEGFEVEELGVFELSGKKDRLKVFRLEAVRSSPDVDRAGI